MDCRGHGRRHLLIGFLGFRVATAPDTPAAIRVETRPITSVSGGFLVPFVATNDGEQSAAHVIVEGRLHDGDREVDRAAAVLDSVPAHANARGGLLLFRLDLRSAVLDARALGYARP